MSQSNMFMNQLNYLFKNEFKISQIWVKWFKNIIRLIARLLNGSIGSNSCYAS